MITRHDRALPDRALERYGRLSEPAAIPTAASRGFQKPVLILISNRGDPPGCTDRPVMRFTFPTFLIGISTMGPKVIHISEIGGEYTRILL